MDTKATAAETARGMALEGRARAVIEGVTPEIDGGRFPVKRVGGESVTVSRFVTVKDEELLPLGQ